MVNYSNFDNTKVLIEELRQNWLKPILIFYKDRYRNQLVDDTDDLEAFIHSNTFNNVDTFLFNLVTLLVSMGTIANEESKEFNINYSHPSCTILIDIHLGSIHYQLETCYDSLLDPIEIENNENSSMFLIKFKKNGELIHNYVGSILFVSPISFTFISMAQLNDGNYTLIDRLIEDVETSKDKMKEFVSTCINSIRKDISSSDICNKV